MTDAAILALRVVLTAFQWGMLAAVVFVAACLLVDGWRAAREYVRREFRVKGKSRGAGKDG